MPRWLKLALLGAGGLVLLAAVLLGVAWALLPREWISQEAQRQAARLSGADVRWKSLEPGFDGLSIGVRVRGFVFRSPAEGDPTVDARVEEIFVRFKLLPLLSRRVEVAAAKVRGAGIATWDRGPQAKPPAEGKADAGAGMALTLPRLELEAVDIRTRDVFGSGIDVRRLHGSTEITGTLQSPREIRIDVTADSLFWKGSARDPLRALPAPLRVDVALRAAGAKNRLEVSRGVVLLGPLRSDVSGSVSFPPPPGSPALDLLIRGTPQDVRSTDAAFRAFAEASPAAWSTKAAWEIRIGGTPDAMIQNGTATLRPVEVSSEGNRFTLEEVRADWATTADRTLTARASGKGSGLSLRLDAKGSMEPGAATSGTLEIDAPAARLNGLLPDAPVWKAGTLAVRAIFTTRAPAPPDVRWTVTGRDLSGTAPGLAQPIRRLAFHLAGDDKKVDIRTLEATVGSTTASVRGEMVQGKPLGTGAFTVNVDRFVVEEWAPKEPAKGAGSGAKGEAPPPPPPLPFRSLTADVTIAELRQGGMTVRDVRLPVRYDEGTLRVEPIRGAVGTGTIEGALTVEDLIGAPSYALRLAVQRAPVDEVARGLLPFRLGLTGILNGDVELSGPGLPGPEASESLRGSLSGTVEDGRIAENEAIQRIRKALGVGSEADAAFKTISHVLRIEGGRLLLDKVRGDLGADKFEMTGALGLDKSLDVKLLLRLAPERVKGSGTLAELARYARDADGRLPLELWIGGTTEKPKVQLKSGKLLDVAGQGLKESLTKSLTSKLEGATRRGAADTLGTADSAAASPDSVADPVRQGRDALRKLLGK